MNGQEIILSYGFFYHATAAKNWPSIRASGLQPTAEGYQLTGCKGRPLLFLSIPAQKCKWVSTLTDKFDGADMIILEIPAHVVAETQFALDTTSSELKIRMEGMDAPDFKALLDTVGDLVCFDQIPANAIRLCETVPSKHSS